MMPAEDSWKGIPERLAALSRPEIPARDVLVDLSGAERLDALARLQAQIDQCHEGGGGRIVVPAGDYHLKGPLVLRSLVELHLTAGAILRFSGNPDDFLPPVFQRWEGTEVFSHSPLITARNAHDIAITGTGVIEGGGKQVFETWQPIQKNDQNRLRDMGRDGLPIEQRVFGAETRLRPSLLQPIDCERVLIEGVTIRDSPFWIIHPTYCRHVIIRGVTVESMNFNNDGCDPDSCTDVLIEDCTFRTGDDGIAIKSGRDQDGWRVNRPTERVLIRNCTFFSKINGLCIGSEMSGGVRDVFMENCRIVQAASALYLKANADRGGFIEKIHMRGISIEEAHGAVIRFEPTYHSHRGGTYPSVFRDIDIRDIHCRVAHAYGLYLDGSSECPVERVILKNVTIDSAAAPLFLRHTHLDCDGVSINGALLSDPLPAKAPASQPLVF